MSRLRVLMVADEFHPVIGGAIRVVDESARALLRRGHDVWLVCGTDDIRLPAREDVARFHIRRYRFRSDTALHLNATSIVNGARAVRDTLRRHGPFDVVHSHNVFAASGALATRDVRALPRLSTFHGPVAQEFENAASARTFEGRTVRRALQPAFVTLYSRWLRRLQARIVRDAPCVVLSPGAARMVRSVVPRYPWTRLRVVPGGVDLQRFRPAPDRAAIRRTLGVPSAQRLLFAAGRLVPAKGFDRLLDAVHEVCATHSAVHLVIGGAGPIENQLRRQAQVLGIESAVTFAGPLSGDTLIGAYQAADLFVLSSSFEPFGLVALEALACGTPVLTTPVAGCADIVQSIGSEYVTDDTTAGALARGVVRCLDTGDTETIRARCRAFVAAAHSWDHAAHRLEALYDELTSGARAA
jgi:glycosyltransferase involved in cell wall biosynthesis